MNRLTRTLAVAVLGAAGLLVSSPNAAAGRLGGPNAWPSVVPASGSISFGVPLVGGTPTTVTLIGSTNTALELRVLDARGNVLAAVGGGPNKTLRLPSVPATGNYTLQVRNLGNAANTILIGTD